MFPFGTISAVGSAQCGEHGGERLQQRGGLLLVDVASICSAHDALRERLLERQAALGDVHQHAAPVARVGLAVDEVVGDEAVDEARQGAGGSCVNSASSDIRWLSPWASRLSARQRSTVQS